MLDHLYWIIGCTVGSIFGSLVELNTKGIDFVMTALFVVSFTGSFASWLFTVLSFPVSRAAVVMVFCAAVSPALLQPEANRLMHRMANAVVLYRLVLLIRILSLIKSFPFY